MCFIVQPGISLYPLFEHVLRKSRKDDSIFDDKATGLLKHFLVSVYVATTGAVCCVRAINRGTKVEVRYNHCRCVNERMYYASEIEMASVVEI